MKEKNMAGAKFIRSNGNISPISGQYKKNGFIRTRKNTVWKAKKRVIRSLVFLVGDTGFEPVTPTV